MLMRPFLVAEAAEVATVPGLEKDISVPVAEVSPPLLTCALGRDCWDQRNADAEVSSP